MPRREYMIHLRCDSPECRETSFTVAETRKEESEIRARYARSPYRCYRHVSPDDVLSEGNPETTVTLTSYPKYHTNYRNETSLLGLFWGESEDRAYSGLVSGPGFRAICKDFPVGTKLIVTARIEIPQPETTEQE